MATKRCPTCEVIKNLEQFIKPSLWQCRECGNKRIRDWRHEKRAEVLAARGPVIERTEKQCKQCGEVKPLCEFYQQKGTTWHSSYCKPCSTKRVAEMRKKMPSSRAPEQLKYKTKRMGTTPEWFNSKMESQKGLCAICRHPEYHPVRAGGKLRSLAIDHNHKTGEVRGLLCCKCNQSLHLIEKHGYGWAQAAVEYLQQFD